MKEKIEKRAQEDGRTYTVGAEDGSRVYSGPGLSAWEAVACRGQAINAGWGIDAQIIDDKTGKTYLEFHGYVLWTPDVSDAWEGPLPPGVAACG